MSEVVKNLMDNAVNDAVNEGTAFPGKRIKGPAEVLCERMHLAIVDELARGKDIAVEQIFEGMDQHTVLNAIGGLMTLLIVNGLEANGEYGKDRNLDTEVCYRKMVDVIVTEALGNLCPDDTGSDLIIAAIADLARRLIDHDEEQGDEAVKEFIEDLHSKIEEREGRWRRNQ